MADITHRVSVHVLLLNEQRQVLLMERIGSSSCKGTFGGPSGQVHEEPVRVAGCRYVKEAVGVEVVPEALAFAGICDRVRVKNGKELPVLNVYFWCREWQGEIVNCNPEKQGEPAWYGVDGLPGELFLNTRDILVGERGVPQWIEGGLV